MPLSEVAKISHGEVQTPVGDAPVIPLMLFALGGYLCWFGIHYWRDGAVVWPSDPIKDVLTGKGLPSATPPASTVETDVTNATINAGVTQQARADAANFATKTAGGLAASQAALGPKVPGGSVGGDDIAKDIAKYIGHPYLFGGAPGKSGKAPWDCSSCVNWVVGHDMELSIPSYNHGSYDGSTHGPSTVSWLSWTGCKTVPHKDIRAGDILVWQTHMGIATSKTEMISAEDPAQGTQKSTIKGMQSSLRGEALVARRVRETLITQPSTTAKGGTPAQNQAIGKLLAAQYGWSTGQEWSDLVKLWTKESGWNNKAKNPQSGAYGIAQALGHGPTNQYPAGPANPPTSSASAQIKWGLKYIKETYGSPSKAWAHEVANNWY